MAERVEHVPEAVAGKGRHRLVIYGGFALFIAVCCLVSGIGWPSRPLRPQGAPPTDLSAMSQRVVADVSPSVVRIDVERSPGSLQAEVFRVNGQGNLELPISEQGTGVFVSGDGTICTCYHLVQAARRMRVTLPSGSVTDARLIGVDEITDVAVLQVEANPCRPIVWSDREQLGAGEFVWAFGYPFGLHQTVTFGIISGTNELPLGSQGMTGKYLQTDAVINPGSSGGPLADKQGHIVGLNTAIVGRFYQGIGFAVPAKLARQTVERIVSSAGSQPGWLGASFENHHSGDNPDWVELTQFVDLPGTISPAKAAGLLPGDRLLAVDGQPVDSALALDQRLSQTRPGAVVHLKLSREGRELQVDVVLAARP